MKKAFTLAVMLLVGIVISACSSTPKEPDVPIESVNYLDYTYTEVSAKEFMKAVKENPLKAESEYLNNYITFDGYVFDSTYIQTTLTDSDTFTEVTCTTYNPTEVLDSVFMLDETLGGEFFMCKLHPSLPEGPLSREKMTVWGKVTAIPNEEQDYCSVEVLHYEFEEAPPLDEILYAEYTANDLFEVYLNDPKTAKVELYNAFVSITSPIHKISTKDFKFAKTTSPGYCTFSYGQIDCPFTSDEQKAVISEKNLGDTVTVKGRIAGITGGTGRVHYTIELFSVE